jgi:hypothetical protein
LAQPDAATEPKIIATTTARAVDIIRTSPPLCDAAGLLSRMSKSADRRGANVFIEGNKGADQVTQVQCPDQTASVALHAAGV